MTVFRISSTTLEAFRYSRESFGGTEESCVETVKGEFTGNEKTRCGTDFGSILENPADHLSVYRPVYIGANYRFDYESTQPCVEAIDRTGAFELKETMPIDCGDDQIELVAKVDYIRGLEVKEFKTKFSTFSYDNYERSLQWKCYLAVFGASSVEYMVHCFGKPTQKKPMKVLHLHVFRFPPYPGLQVEVERKAREFLAWAKSRKLEGYLLRKREPNFMEP